MDELARHDRTLRLLEARLEALADACERRAPGRAPLRARDHRRVGGHPPCGGPRADQPARRRHGLGGRRASTPACRVVPPGPPTGGRLGRKRGELRPRGGRSRAVRLRSRARGAPSGTNRPAWPSARRGDRRPAAPGAPPRFASSGTAPRRGGFGGRARRASSACDPREGSDGEDAAAAAAAYPGAMPRGQGYRDPKPAALDAGRTRRERHGGLPPRVERLGELLPTPRSTATSASVMRCG